ncbi:MAG: hypothetical protein DMG58_27620 [Acidobacteria bacterium]|nr:MAG: hypothetical protein DMG58_27620 [Acidobacteriota bacterium]
MASIVLKNPICSHCPLKRFPALPHYLLQKDMSNLLSRHSRDAFTPAPSATMNAHLDLEQYLELLLGPNDDTSAFNSDESRREAWRDYAAELLPMVDPGSRPWAWWQYAATEPVLPREPALAYLSRCGLLTGAERERLEHAGIQLPSLATRNP